MKYLVLPASNAEDDRVIEAICRTENWSEHRTSWLGAYAAYREHGGNPWFIRLLECDNEIKARQYALYDSRKRSGPLVKIRRISGLLSCPICGSPTRGSLDHYLPRSVFPEFAIMQANLVPACNHCNSGAKGKNYKGDAPARFIHPYFDEWADQPLWKVQVMRPLEAATFKPVPMPLLEGDRKAIVQYHLDHVLGEEFHQSLANHWSTLPEVLATRAAALESPTPERMIATELLVATKSFGSNSWYPAFFRGLATDSDALAHVWAKAGLSERALGHVS